jgi:uroporphyrin-3 C-methyltransferase
MSESQQQITNETLVPYIKSNGMSKTGIVMLTLLGASLAGAIAFGYFQLSQVNTTLSSVVTDLKQQLTQNQRELTNIQESLQTVKKTAGDSAQQEQAMATWIATQQGDRSKWDVTEAQYLTKLAEHHLSLTHDQATAAILLQHAQEILQKVTDSSIDPIRSSLAENLASLQAQPELNGEKLYLQMASIYNQLDSLPMPETPLQYTKPTNANQKDDSDAPWWKLQWHKSMEALSKVVLVRYNDGTNMPLILPEAKSFLYQNLHSQLESAMLGVLNRNETVYQTSLEHVTTWIKKYFVQDAPLTINILNQLQALQSVNLQPPIVNMTATLQLFDQYLAQSLPVNPAVTP